jgi:hypothetical protein
METLLPTEQAVEFVERFEIDGVAAVGHDR